MIRIIAGEFRGRRLKSPRETARRITRPTSSRARTILFDLLGPLAGVEAVLDLCAGSGALGLEALSRGAARADFVELDRRAVQALRDNVRSLGLDERAAIAVADVYSYLRGARERSWSLILADPPYGAESARTILAAVDAARCVAPGGRVVIEHDIDGDPGDRVGMLARTRRRPVGRTVVSIYREVPGSEAPSEHAPDEPGAREDA